jgi:protocatechuate 3,4-dioxygenase beta subunit
MFGAQDEPTWDRAAVRNEGAATMTDTKPETGGQGIQSRRVVIKAGATAIGMGAIGAGVMEAAAQSDSSGTPVNAAIDATPTTCVLTPELTQGPYYLADELIRTDITEGKAGVPLKLRIGVSDINACSPLANAAVHVWHCDAHGFYSGVSANSPGSDATQDEIAHAAQQTFLRGIQMTDDGGFVEFDTIYPGWYRGRTVHIHMMVSVGGTAEGGHVAHTGQLFFDDTTSDEVFRTKAYAGRPEDERTLNGEDGILGDHEEEPGFLLELTPDNPDRLEDGFVGLIAVGVDPSATPAAAGGPGGGSGGPPPGNG